MTTSYILDTTDTWTQQVYDVGVKFYISLTVTYAIGKVFMEMFFVLRVYTSFKGSSMALSKHTLVESGLLIVVIAILWCYTWLTARSNIFIQWIALSAEIFLVCWLLILFVSRLSQLILMQKTDEQSSIEMSKTKSSPTVTRLQLPSSSPSIMSVPDTPTTDIFNLDKSRLDTVGSDTEDESGLNSNKKHTITSAAEMQQTLSETQQKLIYVITRSIVLSFIAMVSTILFSVYAFFYVSFATNGLFFLYILWTLDMTTNSLCIYLNFKHSKTSYDRYCHVCHGCIQFLIRRCSAKRIINDNVRKLESLKATPLKQNPSITTTSSDI